MSWRASFTRLRAMPDSLAQQQAEASRGPHLVDAAKLSIASLDRAQRLSAESGERLDTVPARLGLVAERDLVEALARLLSLPVAGARDFPVQGGFDSRSLDGFRGDSRSVDFGTGSGIAGSITFDQDHNIVGGSGGGATPGRALSVTTTNTQAVGTIERAIDLTKSLFGR